MAKRRYSNSKKGKGRRTRGKKSRCTRHTKRHTRRRVHRGGYSCPGGGFELSTGGYASNNGPEWKFLTPTCGTN